MKAMSGKAMYGRKLGMTRLFTEQGESVPVTALEFPPNVIFQVKTAETDGYAAVQVGVGSQKPQRINKPMTKHLAKAKKGFPKAVREIRLDRFFADATFNVGDEIVLEGLFEPGSKVDVIGQSIGKGFAGVIKRHGMKGAQTNTHGTHEYFRHGGSIGCRKFPGRVFKNKRMAGHMGDVRVMQEGLEVIAVRPEENVLLVRGSVPGPKHGTVMVRTSRRK
ncbi:MAG: 50S ribosomal protein L3 [Bdellovibrionales bacterium]|nr:50S ribosomal protein L3 [Bdellovibrionales bacterium]